MNKKHYVYTDPGLRVKNTPEQQELLKAANLRDAWVKNCNNCSGFRNDGYDNECVKALHAFVHDDDVCDKWHQ